MNLMKTLVYKNLRLNKKRTIVTVIGILLATALLASLATLVASFRYSMIEYEKSQKGDYHYAFSGVDASGLEELKENRSIENLYVISGIGFAQLNGCKNPYKPYVYIMQTNQQGFRQACFHLVEGRMAENDREIVIPRHLKTNGRVNYKVGDTITFAVGKRVATEGGDMITENSAYMQEGETLIDTTDRTYKVVGIIERPEYGVEGYSAAGYTCITYSGTYTDNMTVFARYTAKGLRNRTKVTAGILGVDADLMERVNQDTAVSDEEFDDYLAQMEQAKYKVSENNGLIRYESLYPLDSSFRTLFVIAGIAALIIIVTSVYCIKNSFDISITEKIRQYGMLASVGATARQIRKSVKLEAAMLGIVGIPLGIGCGMLASFVLTRVVNLLLTEWIAINIEFHASWIALALSLILAIVTIDLSAVGSARKAARVTPLEAIRNTNEIRIKPGKLKTPRYISRIWGIGGVISYKNIKRNHKKYRTTMISIGICTVTFIVISYFMSMAYHLVEMSYQNSDHNLSVNINSSQKIDNEELADMIREQKGIQECVVDQAYYLTVYDPKTTKEYGDYMQEDSGDEENNQVVLSLQVLILDEQSYETYADRVGIRDTNGGGILVNKTIVQIFKEGAQKPVSKEMEMFQYKKGDSLRCTYDEPTDPADEEAVPKSGTMDIPIAGMTNECPLGQTSMYHAILVMDEASWNQILGDKKFPYDPTQEAFIMADDADAVQDALEKELAAKASVDGFSYYINNSDKNMRSEQALFTLIGIFAYGLIVVIALIGITNIINTLSTSMELRSREFATLRSIGMTDRQFARMVRLESLFIAGKSLVIGIPAGLLISGGICLIENRMDVEILYRPPVGAILLCAVVVILLIYVIMKLSMNKLTHKNIIDTIKNENL